MAVQSTVELEHSLRRKKYVIKKYPLKTVNQIFNQDGDVLKPNVVMIVGKNAEVADKALLSPK